MLRKSSVLLQQGHNFNLCSSTAAFHTRSVKFQGHFQGFHGNPVTQETICPDKSETATSEADVPKVQRAEPRHKNAHLSTLPAIFTAKVNIW